MTTDTVAQSALQQISRAEAEARERMEQARTLINDEELSFVKKEETRLAEEKKKIKELTQAENEKVQKDLQLYIDQQMKELETEKSELRTSYEQKKGSVIKHITDHFFSLAS